MNPKLDGAGVVDTDKSATPELRMLMTETAQAPVRESIRWTQSAESIRWTQSAQERAAATRRDRIAIAAYYLAEARGFAPGHDAEDWSLAQAQIDAKDAATFEG
jgi:hypothetical protein